MRWRRALALAPATAIATAFALVVACEDHANVRVHSDAADALAETGDAAAPVSKGARMLGLQLDIGSVDYAKNVHLAQEAGVSTTSVSFGWDQVEIPVDVDAGDAATDASPATTLFQPRLHIANLVLEDAHVAAVLAIEAADVGGIRFPSDISGRPFDDVEVMARYARVLDYALDQTRDTNLTALLVASGVDQVLGDDPAKYAAFATFMTNTVAHAHGVRPGVKVGFSVTADGAAARRDLLSPSWAASDVVSVAYVPVDAEARVRNTEDVIADVDKLVVALPTGKPIVIGRAAYPSSQACGSDETRQAAFVATLFRSWDLHAERISVVALSELDDAPADVALALAKRQGRTDAPFIAMLGSLGLRAEGARKKSSFDTFAAEARVRGF